MDLRYDRQISNAWYILFSVGLFLLWFLVFQRYKWAALGILAALLVCAALYLVSLPPYTYQQAIRQLEQQYQDTVFSAAPAGSSSLAPHYHQGQWDYDRYVVMGSGECYYFDQFTGEFGRITTSPSSHIPE